MADYDVGALKAGFDLVNQPSFDAPDIVGVKELWGQSSDFAGLIPVEEAAQRYGDMTGIPVNSLPDEELDVAHQPIIRGRLIPRFLARSRAFLFSLSHVRREVHTVLKETCLWESSPIVARPSIMYSSNERHPVTGLQGHGQRNTIVEM
jgi:hypothetical protein